MGFLGGGADDMWVLFHESIRGFEPPRALPNNGMLPYHG